MPVRHAAGVAAIVLLAACSAPTRPAAVSQAPAPAVKPTQPPAAAPAAIGAAAQPKADGPQVAIKDFAFGPKEITVPVGATLTWTNNDTEAHSVATNDKAIASKALDTGDAFAFRFDVAGTYAYHCSLHPYMTGTVVVR